MGGKDDDLLAPLKVTGWDRIYVPTSDSTITSTTTQTKHAIVGNESQVLTIDLPVGESVESEPGTMMYLTDGIEPSIKCAGCFGRCCSGEACYDVSYVNVGTSSSVQQSGYISLTPNFPTAKVVPVDMSSPEVGEKLLCQQGAYMAKYGDVTVDFKLDCNLTRCCCAGTGLFQQQLSGTGTVFLASTGTILQKVLEEGEKIQIDTNCILAWASTVTIDIRKAGTIMGMIGGGEGFVNTVLTGPGLVLIRSMDEEMFRHALANDKMWRR